MRVVEGEWPGEPSNTTRRSSSPLWKTFDLKFTLLLTFKLKGMGVGRQRSREGEICSSRKKILPSVY